MAMVISTVRKYVPSFGGNKEKPEAEQIVAYLKNINVKQRQTQLRKFMSMKPETIMQELMEEKQSNEIHTILENNVKKFDNLVLQDETGEERPATIKDLIEQGEWLLCVELFMNIVNSTQLSSGLEKNLESQSGSTPPALDGEVVGTAH